MKKVAKNVYALFSRHCGPHSSSIKQSILNWHDRLLKCWLNEIQKGDIAWRLLITTSKGVAFTNVKRAELPNEAWHQLTAYYQVDPKKLTVKVDRNVAEMKRANLDDKENQIHVTSLNGILHEYQIEIRILDCETNLTRNKIELIIGYRFERLHGVKEEAGSKAFAAVRKKSWFSKNYV